MTDELGRILVIGASGQIGSELTSALRDKYGKESVLAADKNIDPNSWIATKGKHLVLDVLDKRKLYETIEKYQVDTIFNLAAILSARGEQNPQSAFEVNIIGTYNTLECSRKLNVDRIIIPSSIAVFGPEVPKVKTPDQVYLRPRSMYGVTKVTGEILGYYYWEKYGLDVRELRLPGVISYKTLPGGGTTDYAVSVFYEALMNGHYDFFVDRDTKLPMMYMPDCIRSIILISEADKESLKERTNYNIGAMEFTAEELAQTINKYIPEFTYDFTPDYRQKLADSWPQSVDDSAARSEWGWEPKYDMDDMVIDMLENLSHKLGDRVKVCVSDGV